MSNVITYDIESKVLRTFEKLLFDFVSIVLPSF
jgi:hypothetical protein